MNRITQTISLGFLSIAVLAIAVQTPVQAQATDVDCNGCVDSRDLADESIKSKKLAKYSVQNNRLSTNAISTGKIRDGAVTSDKIAADAVGITQIDPTQVQQRVSDECAPGHHMTGISQIGTVICTAGPNTGNGGPATATVAVDCDAGDSITDALAVPAVELTIEISGICEEDVFIGRSDVKLIGVIPSTDGIRPDPGGLARQVVTLESVHDITIENLSLADANIGIGINHSYGVSIINSVIEDNSFAGVIAGNGSGSIHFVDMVITSNGVPGDRGLWAANASSVTCTRCAIDNQDVGIRLDSGAVISIDDSTISGSGMGVAAYGGSRIFSKPDKTGPTIIDGTPNNAMFLIGNSSARLDNSDSIIGRIRVHEKSVALFDGTTQTNASLLANFVTGGSSLITRNSSTLVGDVIISEFSNVTLPTGSTVAGNLSCALGADAFCDIPGTATTSSDCGQCLNP